MASIRAKITALGCYVPPRVLTNADLERLVETNDEWIHHPHRHLRAPHRRPRNSHFGSRHLRRPRSLSQQRGIDASEIDAIIVCTVTPDMLFPSTVCLVQKNLGAAKAWGFDLIAACSGFVYGLTTAASFIASGTA